MFSMAGRIIYEVFCWIIFQVKVRKPWDVIVIIEILQLRYTYCQTKDQDLEKKNPTYYLNVKIYQLNAWITV